MISYPPLEGKGSPMLTQNRQFQWYHAASYIYPVVAASAATLLSQNGFRVVWNDCIAEKLTWQGFIEIIKKEKPSLIVFETKTPVVKQHWKIIDRLKAREEKAKVVLMGDHITALPKESMENSKADFVITGGDYDFSLLGLAKYLRDGEKLPKGFWYREGKKIKNTGRFKLSHDLNSLPFIDRKFTKAHLYGEKWKRKTPFFYTMAGRDCWWGKCIFCSWTTLYPKFRLRTQDNLLDEIEFLIKEHNAKEVFDDTGTFPAGKWLEKFCQSMIRRGFNKKILFSCNMRFGCLNQKKVNLMKKAGFRKLKMGLESASQKTLDRLNKGVTVERIVKDCKMISRVGIDIHLTVMVGYPWETKKQALKTLSLAKKLMEDGLVEMLQSTIIIPYPGTPLYKEAIKNKWFLIKPDDYDKFDMSRPVLKTPGMQPIEINKLCADVYKIFFSPKFIWQRLKRMNSLEDLKYLLRGPRAVFGHIEDFFK